jgi:hypothetical protein
MIKSLLTCQQKSSFPGAEDYRGGTDQISEGLAGLGFGIFSGQS